MNLYHVVEQSSKSDFEAQCSKYIGMGYEPVGGMSVENPFNPFYNETIYRQAFIKNAMSTEPTKPAIELAEKIIGKIEGQTRIFLDKDEFAPFRETLAVLIADFCAKETARTIDAARKAAP